MMRRKNKKVIKYRGGTTHGYGSMKKNRGAGNRGGRGMAGTGKRGDAKKPSINPKKYFGKHGFKSLKKLKQRKRDSINVADLDRKLPSLLKDKLAEQKDGSYHIDLKKLGYSKLLGTGETNNKYVLTVPSASKSATVKIDRAGGKVRTESAAARQVKEKAPEGASKAEESAKKPSPEEKKQ